MRNSATGLIAIALLATPLLGRAQSLPTERNLREECSAFSQAGMRDCLAAKAAASAGDLKKAEARLLARIAKWDEDARFKTAARARFQASRVAFDRYRAAACEFQASLGGGAIGNALSMRRLACIAELNTRRIEAIDRVGVDLP
jgi:Lysozyme inhibitor LprI